MGDKQKKDLIYKEYIVNNKSFHTIASELKTYANKLRRDAIKFQIPVRDRSSAQSNAIKTGKHKHPTKGKIRSEDVKNKIGESVMRSWENLDEETKKNRKIKAQENWFKLSEDDKMYILNKANEAVRLSSKLGSKLEKFLLSALVEEGHRVEFHKEHILSNTKLQLDLFLPMINLAIEVDGPSHFEDIWGNQALNRNKKYDSKKDGLITGKGISLIRIKQLGDFSKSRARKLLIKLMPLIKMYPNSITLNLEY
jgi:very-short-patch-repair endonuclease